MNMRKMVLCFPFIVWLGLNPVVAAPTNFLMNPGFDTGDLTGWIVGGPNGGVGVLSDGQAIPGVTFADFLPAYQNVRSGSYAAYAVTAFENGEYASFRQTMNLAPGAYTAGFYMGHDQATGFGIGPAIGDGSLGIWVEGVLLPFHASYASNFPPGSSPSDFTQFEADFTTAGGLTTIEFRISGSGTVRAGISVDDFSLIGEDVVIPAPGAAVLVALGSGLVAWRRRHKAW